MRAPPETLPPPAIVAERDWIIGHFNFKQGQQIILDRLCKDKVWHQLAKRSPAITRPLLIEKWSESHQGAAPDEKGTNRELALQMAFRGAFFLAISNVQTETAAERRESADFYRKRIKQLQKEASLLAEVSEEAAEHARSLAAFYAALGMDRDEPPLQAPRLLVHRHQKPPQMRAYGVLLAGVMRNLYGDVLREIIASIVNAAFNRTDISKEDIRYWCK